MNNVFPKALLTKVVKRDPKVWWDQESFGFVQRFVSQKGSSGWRVRRYSLETCTCGHTPCRAFTLPSTFVRASWIHYTKVLQRRGFYKGHLVLQNESVP